MGAQSLFCCFKNQTPNCISLFAIVINIISIVLMVWSFIDVEFFKTTSKVLYIISFILLCLGLIFFVIIFFFFKLKRAQNSKTVYSTGRCLCLTIIALCALAPVLIVIGFVINLLEYLQWEEDNPSKEWSGREWVALYAPAIFNFLALITLGLCANVLFKKLEQITSSRFSSTVGIKSAWNSTVSNMRRSEIFPEISGIIQNKNDKIPDIVKKIENGANNPK